MRVTLMSLDTMPLLAAVQYEHGFDIDRTLLQVVARLRKDSLLVGGVLQEVDAMGPDCCRPLNVVDIRTGETARITQDRGREARGCKLDPQGLASIAHCISDAIEASVDLIVINRFGKAESEGGGLLSCISDAVSGGIPLLTAVRSPYVDSWRQFHGGLAIELAPSVKEIRRWCLASCRQAQAFKAGVQDPALS